MMRFPYQRPFLFQRLALTFGVAQGFWRVWWEQHPDWFTFTVLFVFGIVAGYLADLSLHKIDPLLEKLGVPIGRTIGLGLAVWISLAIASIPIAIAIGPVGVYLVYSGVCLFGIAVIGLVVYAGRLEKLLWILLPAALRPAFRKSSPILSPACLFASRHGPYRLHAVTQIILIF